MKSFRSRLLARIRNVICSCFYELWWETYTQVNGGQLKWANPGCHEWHRPFVADPFLFHHQGTNWLFYETVNDKWVGKIGCFKEVDGEWEQQGIVLENPWHMSYPQVFEEDGHIYMIPEQSNNGDGNVSLYEAMDFPRGWVKRKVLIERPFADSTLLKKDNHYYLACYTIPPHETAELWHAPTLFGPWKRHPQWGNINQSNRLRRCGGNFIWRGDKLYRIAQDCNRAYGKRLFMVEVVLVSPNQYKEGDATVFLDRHTAPHYYKHTYNEIKVGLDVVSVFDCRFYHLKPLPKLISSVPFFFKRIFLSFRHRLRRRTLLR